MKLNLNWEAGVQSEIWVWYRGFYKVYLTDAGIKRQIAGWQGCREHGKYFLSDGRLGWDIIFPSKYYDKVAGLVFLPPKKKNMKRVLNGRKIGQLAVEKDRLGLQKDCTFANN
jgi:hypothetical protein